MAASHMVCLLPYLSSNASIRRLRISLPLIECLVDGVRYFREGDLPAPSGDDLGPLYRPRLTLAAGRPSPHRNAALAQDAGDPHRAAVDPAVERRRRPATPAQHAADGNAAGDGQGPDAEAAPLALADQH